MTPDLIVLEFWRERERCFTVASHGGAKTLKAEVLRVRAIVPDATRVVFYPWFDANGARPDAPLQLEWKRGRIYSEELR